MQTQAQLIVTRTLSFGNRPAPNCFSFTLLPRPCERSVTLEAQCCLGPSRLTSRSVLCCPSFSCISCWPRTRELEASFYLKQARKKKAVWSRVDFGSQVEASAKGSIDARRPSSIHLNDDGLAWTRVLARHLPRSAAGVQAARRLAHRKGQRQARSSGAGWIGLASPPSPHVAGCLEICCRI